MSGHAPRHHRPLVHVRWPGALPLGYTLLWSCQLWGTLPRHFLEGHVTPSSWRSPVTPNSS
jgi:hypothetical protein